MMWNFSYSSKETSNTKDSGLLWVKYISETVYLTGPFCVCLCKRRIILLVTPTNGGHVILLQRPLCIYTSLLPACYHSIPPSLRGIHIAILAAAAPPPPLTPPPPPQSSYSAPWRAAAGTQAVLCETADEWHEVHRRDVKNGRKRGDRGKIILAWQRLGGSRARTDVSGWCVYALSSSQSSIRILQQAWVCTTDTANENKWSSRWSFFLLPLLLQRSS